jgi:indolepyruvate ferredoxin oxidoreductase beta subunit
MALNMVLLGALIQTQMLPLTKDQVTAAIGKRTRKNFLDINLAAFEKGYAAAEGI